MCFEEPVSKGDRARGSRAMHILAGTRDGKISGDNLGVATPLPETVV